MMEKDQLTEKLIGLFTNADADLGNIDKAVAMAKEAMAKDELARKTKQTKQVKQGDLEKLFDSQIATLNNRDCPEAIVEMFQNRRGEIVARASEMIFGEGCVPFIPVIPRNYHTIYGQMPMVRWPAASRGEGGGRKKGYTLLDPTEIIDVVETRNLYYIYYISDVEDGTVMLGKTPRDAEMFNEKNGRSGLTDVEVISLCLHTNVLSRHYVDAIGSRCRSGGVPSLCNSGGRPKLIESSLNSASNHRGAASYGGRLEL